MRDFSEIHDIAAKRKGGASVLDGLLRRPLPRSVLAATPDDPWLATMAKALFQAGFNWKVIEAKWEGFEIAFDGFDPQRVAFYNDEHLDRLLRDKRIVRNGAKIAAVIENARFVSDLMAEHESTGAFFADWPNEDFVGLLEFLKKHGSRLGGTTGQRVMRVMGRDAFMLSSDVTARLIAEGVIDKPATSKRDLAAILGAFNTWAAQSGRSLTEISQTLAMSV